MKQMKKLNVFIIIVVLVNLFVIPAVPSFAGGAKVEQTGQTTCFDKFGTVDCEGTGQDGELQKGVQLPEPRFIEMAGAVKDKLTALEWLQDANCAATIDFDPDSTGDGSMTWQNALDFVEALNNGDVNCGQNNKTQKPWRLPNIKELQSLIHYGFIAPALSNTAGTDHAVEGDPFTNLQLDFYWSSTTVQWAPGSAFILRFVRGFIDGESKENDFNLVWAVRGGK